ncbi:MAG: CotH kinase family protein [Phycisphaeraceae bacterium]|nr:CotH kinase family protein [Phycisphaeraceae bacterium]
MVAVAGGLGLTGSALGQDLYDPTVLRTFAFQFHDPNWMTLLRNNYVSQTNILADLTVDGITYNSVGVRIRGNTSYTALPAGSEKFSLNVDVDFVNPNQSIQGYSSLNLNNGWRDPTFCREAMYNTYVSQFIPNPRANQVVVTLNGANWGVYVNVQQFNKKMLSTHFADTNGLRIKCANNPNGPGLTYNGTNPAGYSGYEIKDDGGLADPWGALIAVCNAVTNGNLANWSTTIDPLFAVDPSTWSVVLENYLTDDDSYINKGADFMTYRNPTDSRTFLLQTDANETFTQTSWAITRNFTATNKPVLSRVLSVAENRQRYMAHYRTVKQDMTWAYFGPKFTAMRNLIDAAVQADPKKLYSYTLFQNNFTQTVTMPYSGLAGGSIIGLQQFVEQRATFLNSQAELVANGPTISSVTPSSTSPDPANPVTITAVVAPNGSPLSGVDLYYRPSPTGTFQRVAMNNLGSGNYSVVLPITASPGQRVSYYVRAVSANTYLSQSFFPARTEWAPLKIEYTFGASGGMRITEYMYSGTNGEFVEFTNRSKSPVDMTGWSMDDDHATPGAFSLSALGTVQPGESVIVTEANAETFRAAWGLSPSVKIIGQLGATSGNNFARNDEINLYDNTGQLVDRLTYGDQTFPGTIRAQNASGQTCRQNVGQNTIATWVLSAIGDVHGSWASSGGDRGTPGSFTSPSCVTCYANCDGSSGSPILTANDFQCFLNKFAAGDAYANCDQSTGTPALTANDFQCFLNAYAAGCQ